MTAPPVDYPRDPCAPGMTEDDWLLELADWDVDQVRELTMRDDITHACRAAAQARQDMLAQSARDRGAAFDRVVNRLRGKPAESPKVVIHNGPTVNIAPNDLFAALDRFAQAPRRYALPAELAGELPPGSVERPADPEGPGH